MITRCTYTPNAPDFVKTMVFVFFTAFLTGCFAPPTLDASTTTSVKTSIERISKELTERDREEFTKAIIYFSLGSDKGLSNIFSMANKTEMEINDSIAVNMKKLDGLSGAQILEKYRQQLELDRRDKEKKETLNRIQNEANELLSSRQYKEAIEKFNELSTLEGGLPAAKEGLNEANIQMNLLTEKMKYIDQIEITEFIAKRISTYSDKNIPAYRVSIKNNGSRSLDKIAVTVYFQDSNGNIIFEDEYLPVYVSKYNYESKPLKPGYIFEMEKDKYHTVKSPLSTWKEGAATIKITDIEFSK